MSVKVKYKGEQILFLNTDTEKALATEGQYCEGDIVVENVQDGGITPTGSIEITENGTYDVTEYESADVNVSGGTEITDGIVVKARNANGYATEVDYYGDTVYPWTFGAGNENGANTTNFSMRHIKTVNLKNTVTKLENYAFAGATELTTVNGMDWDAITEVGTTPIKFTYNWHFDVAINANKQISFANCGITSIVANEWTQIPNNCFNSCNRLVSAKFPKVSRIGNYSANQFRGCTALQVAEFGSLGFGVTGFPEDNLFVGCTQSGLTIIFYTNGSRADTALSKSRAGAANATIIVKASENTTYNGVAYSAGDTMITSTP